MSYLGQCSMKSDLEVKVVTYSKYHPLEDSFLTTSALLYPIDGCPY